MCREELTKQSHRGTNDQASRQIPSKRWLDRIAPRFCLNVTSFCQFKVKHSVYFYKSVLEKPESRLVFLDYLPDRKLYISEQRNNLDFEAVQPGSYRASTASVCVDLLAVFFFVIVLQRVNKIE
jgi:hypothetical protein